MKLEEIIPLLREGKKIEFLTFDRNGVSGWREVNFNPNHLINFYGGILDKSLIELMETEFRLKKQKVKKYQVLFKIKDTNTFIVSGKKFRNEKDFTESWYTGKEDIFHSLILESEEEFEG